ncbi:uncharacterized protein SOCE26_041390 [Sorangium cellulosum]|uniref:Uncharacterized protein n=1 Tax=Sorangium cellulosum TaxID=56 RepID=A0A2L0ETT5_SORCE|nr:hypothetical protein [Sorangium cellulosum]AUX42706.1 uncharacterized protein SOCE26_041390 [Sorangium cellulosum]
MRDLKGIVEMTLLVEENGALTPAREYFHRDTAYVEGRSGQRYALRVRNLTGGRVEVVPTVDGLDVQSGKDASFDLRGHVIDAHGSWDFTGFRISQTDVATFRFGSIEQSYAAQIGKPRNVGVIGLAVFEERAPLPPPPPTAAPPSPPPMFSGAPPIGGAAPAPAAPPPSGAVARAPMAPPGFGPPAPAPGAAYAPAPQAPKGLGTTFGERRESRIHSTTFDRATPKPAAVLVIRYEQREGLRALGIAVDGLSERETASPFPAETGFAKPPPGWRG